MTEHTALRYDAHVSEPSGTPMKALSGECPQQKGPPNRLKVGSTATRTEVSEAKGHDDGRRALPSCSEVVQADRTNWLRPIREAAFGSAGGPPMTPVKVVPWHEFPRDVI